MACFSKLLREHRLNSRSKLREIADYCDTSVSYLSDIELGKKNPSLELVKKIEKYFGIEDKSLYKAVEEYNSLKIILNKYLKMKLRGEI